MYLYEYMYSVIIKIIVIVKIVNLHIIIILRYDSLYLRETHIGIEMHNHRQRRGLL